MTKKERRIYRFDVNKKDEKKICVICKEKPAKNLGWIYTWKGESGNACHECAVKFYAIGNYLLDRAVETLKAQGIKIDQVKDKLGGFRIYVGERTQLDNAFIKSLEASYRNLYPEFEWLFL